MRVFLAVLMIFCASSAIAGDISGKAIAVDGDTITIKMRLQGIDAPEYDQPCTNKKSGKEWPCGIASKKKLAKFIKDKVVSCKQVDTDKYLRPVVLCSVDGQDLNRMMVTSGMAPADPHYTTAYVEDGKIAEQNQKGMWDSDFQMPWDYRHSK